MNTNPLPTPASRCASLRTKALYISSLSAAAFRGGEENADEPSPVCWCNRTLGELGPDREPVDVPPCSDPNRDCYRASPAGQLV